MAPHCALLLSCSAFLASALDAARWQRGPLIVDEQLAKDYHQEKLADLNAYLTSGKRPGPTDVKERSEEFLGRSAWNASVELNQKLNQIESRGGKAIGEGQAAGPDTELAGLQSRKDRIERTLWNLNAYLDRKLDQLERKDSAQFLRLGKVEDNSTKKKKVKFMDLLRGSEEDQERRLNESKIVHMNGKVYNRIKFYHMHIPRTGGTSFFFDVHRTAVNATMSMVSREGCYNWRKRLGGIDHVATFVRNPRSHVLSQFLYCSEGSIKLLTQVHKFTTWLEDWTRILQKAPLEGDYASRSHSDRQLHFQKYVTQSFLPFHCYSPQNLMVQHFTCKGGPFNYSKEDHTKLAIQNMQDTYFVGITEAYQESLCLFSAKVHDKLPPWCDCRNRTAWHSFNASHSGYYVVPVKGNKHNISSWKPETVQLVDALTKGDRALYQAAVHRFAEEIHGVEGRFGTSILCEEKLASQSQAEDPVQNDFASYIREAQFKLKEKL